MVQPTEGAAPPSVEVFDEPTQLVYLTNIPYAERNDIRVDVAPKRVRISVQVRMRSAREISARPMHVPFERVFELDAVVEPERAEARLNGGVLEVVVPKLIEPLDPILAAIIRSVS